MVGTTGSAGGSSFRIELATTRLHACSHAIVLRLGVVSVQSGTGSSRTR
jgi:hypothetical protein